MNSKISWARVSTFFFFFFLSCWHTAMRLVRYLPAGFGGNLSSSCWDALLNMCTKKKTQSQVLWLSRWGTKVSVTKFGRRSKRDYRLKENVVFFFIFTNFGWTCTSGRVWAWQCWHMTTLFTCRRSAWPPGCTSSWDTMGCLHCPYRDSNALLHMPAKQCGSAKSLEEVTRKNQVVSANRMLLLMKADGD